MKRKQDELFVENHDSKLTKKKKNLPTIKKERREVNRLFNIYTTLSSEFFFYFIFMLKRINNSMQVLKFFYIIRVYLQLFLLFFCTINSSPCLLALLKAKKSICSNCFNPSTYETLTRNEKKIKIIKLWSKLINQLTETLSVELSCFYVCKFC